ncbi:2-(1,2-epoxy-1,2-dihydrophenyl)acetyl-CoA isomerase [Dyadobacter koreensis]|uniref:2-(1,2-epoxy-1,2-dihydrophenyl)acetyl-CoA isomerase n=1 Tax=Dyadobacter koreensis TaxID=408657 RepID=A0A1H6ZUI8_9BACT|nr:enoyl-CoA hydratase-related protein [Dyadobacter koreensis]SEJ53372.1 2-(1,2-epoxy-1,2-dihydrophenyl)acetyl-CoA isomerase [Dyadobacter koreensis]
MYQNLLFDNNDGVVRISLNRPAVHNALSLDLIGEITAAIQEAEKDPTVRVIVLTGEGDKAFCSGADLKTAMESGKSAGEMLRDGYNPMIEALRNIPKPVICKLNGLAVGAGCSLALACDIIISSEDAYLSQMFVHIGLMPDAGASFFLPRLVGMAKAFELASTGRKVYAPEAVQIGLINKSVSREKLEEAVEEAVSYYRNAPTAAIGAMKKVLNRSYESNLSEILNLEAENQDILFKTRDAAEGISSFFQKKKPDYQGR